MQFSLSKETWKVKWTDYTAFFTNMGCFSTLKKSVDNRFLFTFYSAESSSLRLYEDSLEVSFIYFSSFECLIYEMIFAMNT